MHYHWYWWLGHTGLPLVLRHWKLGCKVIRFNADKEEFDKLQAEEPYVIISNPLG